MHFGSQENTTHARTRAHTQGMPMVNSGPRIHVAPNLTMTYKVVN